MDVLRCRFLEHIPGEIMHLCVSSSTCLCLLQDSSILVYNLPHFSLRFIYPPTASLNLRKLIISENTFITSGLGGLLLFYSLDQLLPLSTTLVPGGGVWDISTYNDSTLLACDDGVLRIYQLEDNEFFLLSSFPKQDSKLLCVFSHGKSIYTGTSKGSLLKFNEKGTILQRMNSESAIWCIQHTNETLISGESNGLLCFWNETKGVLKQQIKTHEADILTMCVRDDEIFASGVDSKVVRLSMNSTEWIVTGKVRGQSHDIRTLAVYEGLLLSGGVTSDICVYTGDLFTAFGTFSVNKASVVNFKKAQMRHIPTLSHTMIKTCKDFILHSKGHALDLWSIDDEAKAVTKLVTINLKSNQGVSAFSISSNAKWIVYSTLLSTKLLKFDLETFEINKCEPELTPCSSVGFGAECLYLAYVDLKVLSLKTFESEVIYRFNSFAVNMCIEDAYCAVLLASNDVYVFKGNKFLFTLPPLTSKITAIGFAFHKTLYLVTEQNQIHGFSCKTQESDLFTSKYSHMLPKNFLNEVNRTIGINKYGKSSLIVYTHYSFTLINLSKKPPKKCEILTKDRFPEHKHTWAGVLSRHSLHSKKKSSAEGTDKGLENFVINKRFGPIMDFSFQGGQWILAELDWEKVLEIKPKPLSIHKYGT